MEIPEGKYQFVCPHCKQTGTLQEVTHNLIEQVDVKYAEFTKEGNSFVECIPGSNEVSDEASYDIYVDYRCSFCEESFTTLEEIYRAGGFKKLNEQTENDNAQDN